MLNGAWCSVVVKALRYKSVGPGIDSKRWHLEFILWQLTFPCALGSNQPIKKNEYHDIIGGKGGRCVRVTTLPPSYAECLVIWSFNRPEHSGPHRPVIGIALPFYYCGEPFYYPVCGQNIIYSNCTTLLSNIFIVFDLFSYRGLPDVLPVFSLASCRVPRPYVAQIYGQ